MSRGNWLSVVAVSGCVIAIAICCASIADAQPNNPQEQPATTPTDQAQNYSKRPLPITVIGPIGLERKKAVEPNWAKPNCKEPSNHDEADLCQQVSMAEATQKAITLNYIQIGIGILTLIGLAFTVYYTRTTADAAVDAAQTAKQGLESIERAFVFLKYAYAAPVYRDLPHAITPGARAIEGWHFHIVWENAGSTPTQHMYSYRSLMIFDGDMPEDFTFPDVVRGGGERKINRTFIGPKAEIDTGAFYIPLKILNESIRGGKRIYMWGWAEYSDIFRPKERSRSEFCFEIVPVAKVDRVPDEGIKPPFQFVAYNKHNGSADECYRKPGYEAQILRQF